MLSRLLSLVPRPKSIIDRFGDGFNNLTFLNAAPVGTEYGMPIRQVGPVPLVAAALRKNRGVGATTLILGAGTTLYGLQVINGSAAAAYIQFFNALVAGVTLGTTTPDLELVVPAGGSVNLPLTSRGVAFPAGLSVASTTAEGGAVVSAAGVHVFAHTN